MFVKYEQSLEFGYLLVINQIVIQLGKKKAKLMLQMTITVKKNLHKYRNVCIDVIWII